MCVEIVRMCFTPCTVVHHESFLNEVVMGDPSNEICDLCLLVV